MLKKKREDRIVFTIFDSMHEKFAGLVVNGAQLSKKTNTKIISQVFKLWRLKFINQRNFNFKRHCLEEKIRMKMLSKLFEVLMKRTKMKMYFKMMNKNGKELFAFRRGLLSFNILRQYAHYHKHNKI
jgi:hypothetical protein